MVHFYTAEGQMIEAVDDSKMPSPEVVESWGEASEEVKAQKKKISDELYDMFFKKSH